MPDCRFQPQLHAYHDGQLQAAHRDSLDRHLPGCSPCATELSRLQALSSLFAAAPRAKLAQIAVHRLRRNVEAAMQRSVLRAARLLGAIAACVVLAGTLRLMTAPKPPAAAPPWIGVTPVEYTDAVSDNTPIDAGTPAARWYLADASSHGSGLDEMP